MVVSNGNSQGINTERMEACQGKIKLEMKELKMFKCPNIFKQCSDEVKLPCQNGIDENGETVDPWD